MSKKNKQKKSIKKIMTKEQQAEIKAERMKLGKVQLLILLVMIIAALIFVLPKIQS